MKLFYFFGEFWVDFLCVKLKNRYYKEICHFVSLVLLSKLTRRQSQWWREVTYDRNNSRIAYLTVLVNNSYSWCPQCLWCSQCPAVWTNPNWSLVQPLSLSAIPAVPKVGTARLRQGRHGRRSKIVVFGWPLIKVLKFKMVKFSIRKGLEPRVWHNRQFQKVDPQKKAFNIKLGNFSIWLRRRICS